MAADSKSRRRKKHSVLYAPAAFLVICAAIVFSMSIFFRVSDIEVEGNARYSDEEVIVASGIEKGSNLFFINRFKAISRLFASLPYIESAGITRRPPGRVIIEVGESRALAYVTVKGDFWLIDRNCKLLEKISAGEAASYIGVKGVTPIAPVVGEVIAPGQEEEPKVDFLSALLKGLQARDMIQFVTDIDMSNVVDARFRYQNRFMVKMGENEKVDYKLELLQSAVEQLSEGDSGTIDLTSDRKVSFSPD